MAEASRNINIAPPLSSGQANYTQFEIASEDHSTHQKQKDKWSINFEFILAGVGYTVTYSVIWRLPYMMFRNGGVLFLSAYISCLLLFGVPLFYMETCLGQFWGKGPFHIWKFCPLFRGVGVSFILLNAIYVVYSNPFLSWFVYYTAMSLSPVLPWTNCDNAWNTANCANNGSGFISPASEYFENQFLQLSSGISDLGSMRWELVGCMFGVTALMFGALFFGVRLTGKILCVTATLPYLILFILFLRGITLPGGPQGPLYLFYPNFTILKRYRFWAEAFTQALFTVGVSNGVVHTLASYNRFKAPCLRYSFIVCIITILVGVLAGLALTSLIAGFAHLKGISVAEVMNSGPALVFIAGAEALSLLPAAQFWCFIFFFMFLLLAVTKQFLCLEVFVRTIMDIIPRPDHIRRILVVAVVCFVSFLFTLPFLTQVDDIVYYSLTLAAELYDVVATTLRKRASVDGGVYLLVLFDWYSWKICFAFFAILECVTVTWIYGLDQFSADIKMMTGLRPPIVYKFFWAILIPVSSMIIYIYHEREHSPVTYGTYVYPQWVDRFGYFIAVVPLLPIPIFALIRLIKGRHLTPLNPDLDCRPDTDQWPEYNAKQRQMERSVFGNLRAIFKT